MPFGYGRKLLGATGLTPPPPPPGVSVPDSAMQVQTLINPYESGAVSRAKPGRGMLAALTAGFYAPTTIPAECDVLVNGTGINGGRTALIDTRSGRHWRICGGDLSPDAGVGATIQSSYDYVIASLYVQGVKMDGQLGSPSDMIAVSGRNNGTSMPVWTSDCFLTAHGYNAGTHGDCLQVRDTDSTGPGGISNWAVWNCTLLYKYQGAIGGKHADGSGIRGKWYFKDVDIRYDNRWTPGYAEDASTVGLFLGNSGNITGIFRWCVAVFHQDTVKGYHRDTETPQQIIRPNDSYTIDGTAFDVIEATEGDYITLEAGPHPTSRWEGKLYTAEVSSAVAIADPYTVPDTEGAGEPGPNWAVGFVDSYGDPAISRPPGYDRITAAADLGTNPVAFVATQAYTAGLAAGTVLGYLEVDDAPYGLILDVANSLTPRLKWQGGQLVVNDWFDAETYNVPMAVKDRQSGIVQNMPDLSITFTGSATWDVTKPANKYMVLDPEAVAPDGSGDVAATHGSLRTLIGMGTTDPTLVAGAGPGGQDIITFDAAQDQFYDASNLGAFNVTEFGFYAVMRWNTQNISSSSSTWMPLFGNATSTSSVALSRTSGTGNFTHVSVGTTTVGGFTSFALDTGIVNGQWYRVAATLDDTGYFRFYLDGVEVARGQVGSAGQQQTIALRRFFASTTTATSDVSVVFAMLTSSKPLTGMHNKLMDYLATRD